MARHPSRIHTRLHSHKSCNVLKWRLCSNCHRVMPLQAGHRTTTMQRYQSMPLIGYGGTLVHGPDCGEISPAAV